MNERDGVLILSENAGAHEELGEWALTVNPFDVGGPGGGDHEALTMPAAERRAAGRGDPRLRARARHRRLDRRRSSPTSTAVLETYDSRRERALATSTRSARCGWSTSAASRCRAAAPLRAAQVQMAPATARRLHDLPKGDALDDRAARRDHGGEAHERADPALPSAAALAHRGRRSRCRTASSRSSRRPRRPRRPASRWRR